MGGGAPGDTAVRAPLPTLPRRGEGEGESHLRRPAPGERARAVGALRAVAAKRIEPDLEVDIVAAKPALGQDSGDLGGGVAHAQGLRIHDHPRQPRR